MTDRATLHYVYDPFCGWCYGAAPLLRSASEIDGLRIVAHGGGMLAGDGAQMMTQEWREFVRPHELRITELTGQEFSSQYQEGTQYNYAILMDSALPTAAMLAAQEVNGTGLQMLSRLQSAYYIEGRPISSEYELTCIAQEHGLDPDKFRAAFDESMQHIDEHFAQSHALLARLSGRGYPSLALERDDKLTVFPLGRYFGKPKKFRSDIEALLPDNDGSTPLQVQAASSSSARPGSVPIRGAVVIEPSEY